MEFQRERLQGEVDRVERVLNAILERLPAITVELGGDAAVKAAPDVAASDWKRQARNACFSITSTTTSSPYYINTNITSGVNGITSGAIWTEPAPPRKPTPLEWLDAGVERTCALARAASPPDGPRPGVASSDYLNAQSHDASRYRLPGSAPGRRRRFRA